MSSAAASTGRQAGVSSKASLSFVDVRSVISQYCSIAHVAKGDYVIGRGKESLYKGYGHKDTPWLKESFVVVVVVVHS